MKVGLIDVDGRNYPNVPLMKLSAYHKRLGDDVQWYEPLITGHCDIVYMAKVFTFTEDYEWVVDADKIVRGGSGYYYPDGGDPLPEEVEHCFPDYSLYGIEDTAYGFLTRGCPRGCGFCIVGEKEGRRSRKVADLSEFWNGQKNINLLDPNFFACKEWPELYDQLIQSKALVEFNQGIDIRVITKDMCDAIARMKIRRVHIAWDRMKDEADVINGIRLLQERTGWSRGMIECYCLTNYDTTFEQDVYRVEMLRDLNVDPYVMIYNKDLLPAGHRLKKLQRYANAKQVFWSIGSFAEYAW